METTAGEFIRDFRKFRATAAREQPAKTCGAVLKGLADYFGRGVSAVRGVLELVQASHKPLANSFRC